MIEIRPATIDDAADLAPRLRRADVDELRDVFLTQPMRALIAPIDAGDEALAAVYKGEVVAMFGCSTVGILAPYGVPWLLGSGELLQLARPLVELGREHTARWLRTVPLLANVVDDRNDASKRWLGALGFSFSQPMKLVTGVTVRSFVMARG